MVILLSSSPIKLKFQPSPRSARIVKLLTRRQGAGAAEGGEGTRGGGGGNAGPHAKPPGIEAPGQRPKGIGI